METVTIDPSQTGCWLDNHRGHYLTRDVIELATTWGFIIGPFEEYAVGTYDDNWHEEEYPNEGMTELCDDAIAWLNSGQVDCTFCGGKGTAANGWMDKDGVSRCKPCTGTGRGDRIDGQNYPPIMPPGTMWAFEDGDFGLWRYDDDGLVTD